jgi:hypothetical protein
MPGPQDRDDISRFLVHLTRNSAGESAEDHLISILKDGVIEARNGWCLFYHKIRQKKFGDLLESKFRSVCLTETPFAQLRHVAVHIPGRRIRLQPFGLVFLKSYLVEKGASPAIYINGKGADGIRKHLLARFDQDFKDGQGYNTALRSRLGPQADAIIQYYSLINVISEKHDFAWEREWRNPGDLLFKMQRVFAIIAKDPDAFVARCEAELPEKTMKLVKRVPVVSLDWSTETIIENLSCSLWKAAG